MEQGEFFIKVKTRYSEKKFRKDPVTAFEFRISWLAGKQNYLVKQQFPDQETLWKEKIITKKGSKITRKGNERYGNEFPDRETSYPIGTVFLTVKIQLIQF